MKIPRIKSPVFAGTLWLFAWLSLAPASAASINVSAAQSAHSGQGVTPINLTADGDLGWGAWKGALTTPGGTMSGGFGYTSLSAIGATLSFDAASSSLLLTLVPAN